MTWTEARDGTLKYWITIRDAVGVMDAIELLAEVNAVNDLCEISRDAAADSGNPFDRCSYCLFYQQFGGCQAFSAELSERIVDHDWDKVRSMIDDMIAKLYRLQVPNEGTAAA